MTEQSDAPPWEQAKSHAQLWLDRAKAGSKEEQNELAPKEHKAFAKELVAEKPWMAPSLAVAIPAYQVQKAITGASRSDASMKQVTEAYKGIGEGLAEAASKPWEIAKEWAKRLLQGEKPPTPTSPTSPNKKEPTDLSRTFGKGYKTEADMKNATVMEPTYETDPSRPARRLKTEIAELEAEIANTKNPSHKKILKDYLASMKKGQ